LILILILILALLLLGFLAIEISTESEIYGTQKEKQKYTFNTTASICGNEESNYMFNQELVNLKLRTMENSSTIVNIKTFLEVYDLNGNLVANSKEMELELVTRENLPIDKKIVIYLTCTNDTKSSNLQIPIQEEITVTKDGLFFSEPTLLLYNKLTVNDLNLRTELVVEGLDYPTTMAFLGQDDILVLEKDKGTVQRIVNGKILEKPLIDLNVSGFGEDGLLGISVTKYSDGTSPTYVYLYLTESEDDDVNTKNQPVRNRVYRYEFSNNQLLNPKLVLDLPHGSRSIHNGGKMVVGSDNNLYVTVGDIGRGNWVPDVDTKSQNNKTGQDPDGTGGILRFTHDGKPVPEFILGSKYPLNLYYAYGIRNSFGIDFDPVTGNLWDTENGDFNGDEINLVKPGFNSGWSVVEGMAYLQKEFDSSNLVDFNGKGKYSDPEFNWYMKGCFAVSPTALKFLQSNEYRKKYENDMLVADFNHGQIYRFDLNEIRTELPLKGELEDKMIDSDDEDLDVILAKAPGAITDIQIGPDGYIYIVSL
jgi:aldose sugar dehydrogenase